MGWFERFGKEALTEEEFTKFKGVFIHTDIFRRRGRIIEAITLKLEGIKGGYNRRRAREKVFYTLLVDTAHLKGWEIPRVWVILPPDEEICHVNIFRPRSCPYFNKMLPEICFGVENEVMWENLSPGEKNLFALLDILKAVLNTQNPSSPAREPGSLCD